MHDPLVTIALDLAASLGAEDRYARLLQAVRRVVPCDATALLELQDDGVLVPLVVDGLQPDVVGRRFLPADHPRLVRLLAADGPVRFTGSDLPDPFDGLFESHPEVTARAHACMGAPLRVDGAVLGLLTVDAVDERAFDAVDDGTFTMLAALAGAAMRTALLISALERVAAHEGMVARQLLRERRLSSPAEIVGNSPAIKRIREEVGLIAASDLPVLITGETGAGKDVVAHGIHARSPRHDSPLIQVNCAALPESIAESELFGHVKGAFTGASEARPGKFEVADGGTLFLDEVGELPLSIQPKLLRALQSGEVQRVGADRPVRADVRVVAATNRDLAEEVRAGRFRADLYHRLAVYPIRVPPLRDRPEDVPLLAGLFLDRARVRLGLGPVRLTPDARSALAAYDWPGNVRELDHVLLRAALRASEGRRREMVIVDASHLGIGPAGVGATPPAVAGEGPAAIGDTSLREALEAFERGYVSRALTRCDGNLAEAARRLGMDRGNLHRLAKRLGLLAAR